MRQPIIITTHEDQTRVWVGGTEIKPVKSIKFEHDAEGAPVLTIELLALDITIKGECETNIGGIK